MATVDMDIPVRWGGKVYRLIGGDGRGGLFDKLGLAVAVNVETAGVNALPTVTLGDGEQLVLRRAPRPCSCTGAPWKASAASLLGEVRTPA